MILRRKKTLLGKNGTKHFNAIKTILQLQIKNVTIKREELPERNNKEEIKCLYYNKIIYTN